MDNKPIINNYNLSKEMFPNKEPIKQLVFYDPIEFVRIHNHVNKYICYCEILITKEGLISYAHPSHSEASLVLTGKSKKEFLEEMKGNISILFFDVINYLNNISGGLSLWYDHIHKPSDEQRLTDNQILAILTLFDNGCLEKNVIKELKLLLKTPCMENVNKDIRNLIRKSFNNVFIKI